MVTSRPRSASYSFSSGLQVSGTTVSVKLKDASLTVDANGLSLSDVGVPGTYKSVTTDAKGRITAGTNPTTLAGYGITDALSSALFSAKGSLLASSAAGAPAEVVAGSNGNVLTADSTSPSGVKWAAPASSGVSLQGTTPGTPDTGNLNVSGTALAATVGASLFTALGTAALTMSGTDTGTTGTTSSVKVVQPASWYNSPTKVAKTLSLASSDGTLLGYFDSQCGLVLGQAASGSSTPFSSLTSGTAPATPPILNIVGYTGQSIAGGAVTGTAGAGSGIVLQTGAGGGASNSAGAQIGGAGGAFQFTGGAGGGVLSTASSIAGTGAACQFTCGTGGGASGSISGGTGGGFTVTGGSGGAAASSTNHGSGGTVSLAGGLQGGPSNNAGTGAQLTLTGGSNTSVSSGGIATLSGGNVGSFGTSATVGGDVRLVGGNGSSAALSGSISLTGGVNTTGGGSNPCRFGSITLTTGTSTNNAAPGGAISLITLPASSISTRWVGMATNGSVVVAAGTVPTANTNGDGITDGALAISADDGQTWPSYLMPGGAKTGIAYGNGVFVVVGINGRSYTSADGVNWTAHASATSFTPVSLAFGNGLFVAVLSGASSYTSPDGITWTARTMPVSLSWARVIFAGTRFVATPSFGNSTAVSTDGLTWTSGGNLPSSRTWTSLAYSGSVLVAVNGDGLNTDGIATSADAGSTWTSRAITTARSHQSVAWSGSLFAILNNSTSVTSSGDGIYTSPDGVTWTQRTVPAASAGSHSWSQLRWTGTSFVAVAGGALTADGQGWAATMRSTDGLTWTIGSYLRNSVQTIRLAAGDGGGFPYSNGGNIEIVAGAGGSIGANSDGGHVALRGGASSSKTGNKAGHVFLFGGHASAANNNAGDVVLAGGRSQPGGASGLVKLATGVALTKRTAVADAAYTALDSDFLIAFTSLSAARVITLPAASSVNAGQRYVVKDESGSATGTRTISVAPASGTIDGAASLVVINSAYGKVSLYSNGTNWFTL